MKRLEKLVDGVTDSVVKSIKVKQITPGSEKGSKVLGRGFVQLRK